MIKKALIPASGIGSRVGPITRVIPKEILPLGKEVAIERLMHELRDAKIEDIVIVTTQNKLLFFEEIARVNHWDWSYIIQNEPDGLAGAIKAGEVWSKEEPFVLALPDDFLLEVNPTLKLINEYKEGYLLATVTVEPSRVESYGIVERDYTGRIIHLVEKPPPFTIRSTEAIFGRYILTPDIFASLRGNHGVANGGLTEALELAIKMDKQVEAIIFNETRIDIGTHEGWLRGNNLIAELPI